MRRNYSNKNLTELELANIEFYLNENKSNTLKRNTVKGHQLNGRSIENLTNEERKNRPLGIVELDTVEGIKGGALLFTIMVACFSLMLAFKIKQKTQEEIKKVLDRLEEKLKSKFYVIFRKGIPDNGVEFTNYEALEKSIYEDIEKGCRYIIHTYMHHMKNHI